MSYDPEEKGFQKEGKMNCEQEFCPMHENCLKSKRTDNIYTIGTWQHFQTFFFLIYSDML